MSGIEVGGLNRGRVGRDWQAEFAERRRLIDFEPNQKTRDWKLVFYGIDMATHPLLPANADRRTTLDSLRRSLQDRLEQRIADVWQARRERDFEVSCQELQTVSGWVGEVLRDHFGAAGEFDTKRFCRCFERFSGGELQVVDDHGVPDSSAFFLWPELALAALDHDVDVDVWKPVASIMIRCCEIFALCFHDGHGRRYSNYSFTNNPGGARAFTKTECRNQRAVYEPLGWAEQLDRLGNVLVWALRDVARRYRRRNPSFRFRVQRSDYAG